eukprot:TRINITY_DN17363_c0_g1_i1.p1 TRINITY_DN17363_c0_g1~~TRINITY_DN17363_c0_g1_i1.p1  ORF type:complete len:393 (-),score=14.33 TRINITY_DN17363_c0_g1_i1:75-1253(-)
MADLTRGANPLMIENARLRAALLAARLRGERLNNELKANRLCTPTGAQGICKLAACLWSTVFDLCCARSLLNIAVCMRAFLYASSAHVHSLRVSVMFDIRTGDRRDGKHLSIFFDSPTWRSHIYEGGIEEMPNIPVRFAVDLDWEGSDHELEQVLSKCGRCSGLSIRPDSAVGETGACSFSARSISMSSLEIIEFSTVSHAAQQVLAATCNETMQRLILDCEEPFLEAFSQTPRSIRELGIAGKAPRGDLRTFLASCRGVSIVSLPSYTSCEDLIAFAESQTELYAIDVCNLNDLTFESLATHDLIRCMAKIEVMQIRSDHRASTAIQVLRSCTSLHTLVICNHFSVSVPTDARVRDLCKQRHIAVIEESFSPSYMFLDLPWSRDARPVRLV